MSLASMLSMRQHRVYATCQHLCDYVLLQSSSEVAMQHAGGDAFDPPPPPPPPHAPPPTFLDLPVLCTHLVQIPSIHCTFD